MPEPPCVRAEWAVLLRSLRKSSAGVQNPRPPSQRGVDVLTSPQQPPQWSDTSRKSPDSLVREGGLNNAESAHSMSHEGHQLSPAAFPKPQAHEGTQEEPHTLSDSQSSKDNVFPPQTYRTPERPNGATAKPTRARYSCVPVEPTSEGSSRSQSPTSLKSSGGRFGSHGSWGTPGQASDRSHESGKGSSFSSSASTEEVVLGTVRIPLGISTTSKRSVILKIEPGRLRLSGELAPDREMGVDSALPQTAKTAQAREKILTMAEESRQESPAERISAGIGMTSPESGKRPRFLKLLCGSWM